MDDHPLTPGQKSEPRKIPRERKEGKGKQPANGKPSYKKSSKPRSDIRETRSSPGRQSATVEGVQSLRTAPANAKRSTSAGEHDRSKKLSFSSEFVIQDPTEGLRTTYSQDHRHDRPSVHEEVQEIVVEDPESSLQEDLALTSRSRRRPTPQPLVFISVLMRLGESSSGSVMVLIVPQAFP